MTTTDHGGNAALVGTLRQVVTALPESHIAAFAAVDRAAFVPDQIWVGGDARTDDEAIDRASRPEAWDKAVYDAELPIVTQFDDGQVTWPQIGHRPTCSASAPTVVAGMLRALDPQPGDHVLEIGTGTGYNAALLSEIVGTCGEVVTAEVDRTLAG